MSRKRRVSVHAAAVKTIVRYLKKTHNKRMVLRWTIVLNLEDYVDTSFTGNYGVKPTKTPISVKSQTGIFLAGCPRLIWKLQVQSSNALSTFHIEYVGLSHSMRILIPLRALLLEVVGMLGLPSAIASTIHCRVH